MSRPTFLTTLIATWGVMGVIALCGRAVWSLTPIALEPWQKDQLAGWQIGIYLFWLLFNIYGEGWRGFHKAFSPRTVGRAFFLGENPTILRILFAPVIAMGLFQATRKRVIVSWSLFLAILIVVVLIRLLPQPWRGIIDGGVVAGLGLGILSLIYFTLRTILGKPVHFKLDFPGEMNRE